MKTLAFLALFLVSAPAFAETVRIRCEHSSGTSAAMTLEQITARVKSGYLTATSVARGRTVTTDLEVESQRDVVRDVLVLHDVDARVELTAHVGLDGSLEDAELKLLDHYLVNFTTSKVAGRFDRPVSLTVETPRYSIDVRCALKN